MQIWNELFELCAVAATLGEVPVASAVVRGGEIIASAHNEVEAQKNPAAHAEMLAMQRATNILNNKFLNDCDLYVTLQPCSMCLGAIAHFRVRRLYFASYAHQQTPHHYAFETYGGIQETRFTALLSDFFQQKR